VTQSMAQEPPRPLAVAPEGGRHALLRFGLGAAVTAALVALLLALADWRAMLAAARDLSPLALVGVTALMALTQFARAARLGLMLRTPLRVGFGRLLRVTVLHNLLSMYAPMRLGDLALIWLVKREYSVGSSASVGVFMFVRLLDMLFLLGSAGLAAWFVIPADSAFAWLRYLGPLCVLALTLLLLAWPFGLGGRLARLRESWATSQSRITAALLGALGVFAAMTPGSILRIVAATAAGWACIFASAYAATAAVLPAPDLGLAIWTADGGGLSFALPVTGLANVGTYEATTVAALALADVPFEQALLLAVLLHTAVLLAPLALLPLALAARRAR